jgi:hypothetical protein
LHSLYTCRNDDPNLAQMAAVGALPAPDNDEAADDQGGADLQGLDMDDMVAVGALPAPDQIAQAQVALLQPPQVQRRVGSPTPPVSGRATPSTPPFREVTTPPVRENYSLNAASKGRNSTSVVPRDPNDTSTKKR